MRIGKVEVNGPAEEVLVLPRTTGDIIIKAKAVMDLSDFEAMCPPPVAPQMVVAGGVKLDENNKDYLSQLTDREEKRFAYTCIKSLAPSDIEWETVDLGKPSTWKNWSDDLKNAGLNAVDLKRIVVCVLQANSLDENKINQAREVFLRGQEEQKESSGPQTEQPST